MPKTKPIKLEERRRRVTGILEKYEAISATSDEKAGIFIRRTRQTYQSRKKRPGQFTLDELWPLLDGLGVPENERTDILR